MQSGTMISNLFKALSAIGAINWGLVGLTNFNLVEALFGTDTFMTRLVYTLVGLSGGWIGYELVRDLTQPTFREEVERRLSGTM